MKHYLHPIKRREFLKKGIAGGAVAASFPVWQTFGFAVPPQNALNNPAFQLDQETMQKLLTIALEYGGDFSEIYVEYTEQNNVSVAENKISGATRGIDTGVGIRVLKGDKTGYAHSGDFSFESLAATARAAGLIATGNARPMIPALQKRKIPNYYLVKTAPDQVSSMEKAGLCMKTNAFTRKLDSNIEEVSVSFGDTNKRITIANSEGLWVTDSQFISDFFVMVLLKGNGKQGRGYKSKSGTLGYENFTETLAQNMAKEAYHTAVIDTEAEDAPAGQFPVVFAKEESGVFFHEAIGHSLEADGIRKKTSAFWDKKGQYIASEIVSLADDGTVPGGRGSINVDDEGTPGQNTLLIDKGICSNFLYDKLNAELMNTRSTGNGRRMSYMYYPIPRMTNTYLLAGQDDPEEMVRSTPYGLYVAGIGGGNVDPTTGRFVFEVTEAYLIEDGKKTRPLRGAQLIDNGLTVLKSITMVGPDLIVGGAGTCGKDGQGKPCGDGNPTFKVSSITVGGSKMRKG